MSSEAENALPRGLTVLCYRSKTGTLRGLGFWAQAGDTVSLCGSSSPGGTARLTFPLITRASLSNSCRQGSSLGMTLPVTQVQHVPEIIQKTSGGLASPNS